MNANDFKIFWTSTYSNVVPISYYFKYEFADRWFRIHSLPGSKRYADDEKEWALLFDRQNKIISDLLGNNLNFLLITGEYFCEGYEELHPLDKVSSIANIVFISLEPTDLYKLNPDEHEAGQIYTPRFSKQVWQPQKFNDLLHDIAVDELRAFFVSIENECIIAPYDGGIDFIVKDQTTKNNFKKKYNEWLSAREDGL